MDTAETEAFAQRWAAAWNAHDVEAVLAHFSDDVVFTSPIARQIIDGSDGVIRGKDELRAYWTHALGLIPDLRFELVGVYAGIDLAVINYRNQRGTLVAEVLVFRGDVVVAGHGTYLGSGSDPAGARPA